MPVFESPQLTPPRILLVEDSEHDRRFFRRIIEKAEEKIELTECSDAESALERLRDGHFDLMVADLNMPGMDGVELVRQAQDYLHDTGVMILTGSRDVTAAAKAVKLHILDYLFKEPREALQDNLLPQLRNALNQMRLLRENRRLQDDLRLRLAHLEQIYNQIPNAIFATLDDQGRIRDINPQAAEFLRLAPDEALAGRPAVDAVRGLSAELAETITDHLQRDQPARNVYVESGDRLFLLDLTRFQGAVVANGQAAPSWILTVRDVTPERAVMQTHNDMEFRGIVGRDPSMVGICNLIRRVAPLPTSVLITGPTGAGKEVIARAIHEESDRARKPYIAVNCTALSSEILESELFGHVKGAFTGAIQPRKGRFREADGGTLFLDEIGDTTESFQTKLLRALDSGQIEPVGQDRPVSVDVRIICATNKDLQRAVAEGKFREDLYFRINVVHIQIPPLVQRMGDLPILLDHFRQMFNQKFKKSVRMIAPDAMRALAQYNWPGNVRELRHVLERAFVMAEGPSIMLADLPREIVGDATRPGAAISSGALGAAPSSGLMPSAESAAFGSKSLKLDEQQEADQIRTALAGTGGNIGLAAQQLNVHRTTLWRKMKQYGIDG